ncbi:MAG: hypothetical protein H7333_10020, partial [Bdellovibrionales bacterium]|nr:hypothetical protein [Oligoflexia bacterium]
KNHQLSITSHLLPVYRQLHAGVQALIAKDYGDWYQSMKELEPMAKIIPKISSKRVYLYQAMEDAQVRFSWILEDLRYFQTAPEVRMYPGLGHCFSLMEGTLGEIKTSGPIEKRVIDQLKMDVLEAIKGS